jgi:iron-sulfur cluster assembly accessory protein
MSTIETTTKKAPIKFTDGAIAEVTRLLIEMKETETPYLRVGVKGGGCSGMTYVLGFDKMEDDDTLYELNDVPLIMKSAHAIYLLDMEVDYHQGLNNRGFTFTNPNASSTCGCGTSFAV